MLVSRTSLSGVTHSKAASTFATPLLSFNCLFRLLSSQTVVSFNAEGRAFLFSVEVHHLLSQYSSQGGQTLGFHWCLRLTEGDQIGKSDSAAFSVGSAGEGRDKRREESRRRDVSRMEAGSKGPGSLSYEIRAVSVGQRGEGDVLCSSGPILPPCTGYITPHAWSRCSGVVPSSMIPRKGRIEVWVSSRVGGGGGVRSVEANQLEVTNISRTGAPSRGPSNALKFQYYPASSESGASSQGETEGLKETAVAAAALSGRGEIHQIGGDHAGWTNNLNQVCSLRSADEEAQSVRPNCSATQVPKGFAAVRRFVCSSVEKSNGRKHILYFHAKLSFFSTSRYCRGEDKLSEKKSEVRGSKGYEWRVLVSRGRSAEERAELVSQGSCQHDQSDRTTHIEPWVWAGIAAELGPLHSGDEVLLVTRVAPSSTVGEVDQASNCSVEVSNCEIVSYVSDHYEGFGSEWGLDEGRERVSAMTEPTIQSRGAVFGTIPRIPHTAHFAVFNDQSLALPAC